MKQKMINLLPNISSPIENVDFTDRFIGIYNLGTGRATLGFDQPAVDGLGYPVMPALVSGDLGGGFEFNREDFPRFGGVIHAVSTVGTTLLVMKE